MDQKHDKINLFIIFILTLCIRLIIYFNTGIIAQDGALQYIPVAKLFASGALEEALHQLQTPLYPFIIGLLSKIGLSMELAGRLISLVLSTLTIFPLYFLGKKLFKSADVSFLAGFFYAIHPYFARLSVDVLKEATYIFFLVTAFFLFWEALSRKKVWLYLLVGIFVGFSYLTRADGIEILVLMLLWILFQDIGEFKNSYQRRLISLVCLSIFSFSLVIPYAWHIKQTTGEWNLSKKKNIEILIGQKNVGNEDDAKVTPTIRRHYQGSLLFFSKLSSCFHPLMLILLFFGLIKRKVIPYQKKAEIYLASFFILHLGLLYCLAVNYSCFQNSQIVWYSLSSRHFMPLVVISFFWISMGVYEIRERIYGWMVLRGKNNFSQNLSRTILIFILAVITLSLLPKTLKPQRMDKLGRKIAGIWIEKHTNKKNPGIMTDMPRVAYYGRGKIINPGTFLDIVKDTNGRKVDYVVVNNRYIKQWPPDFIKSCQESDFLNMVFKYQEKKGDKIIVYEVIG